MTRILIITGSRDWRGDPDRFFAHLTEHIQRAAPGHLEIWHGACSHRRGAAGKSIDALVDDCLGATTPGRTSVKRFYANWGTHGPKAGPMRNADMINNARQLRAMGADVRVSAWPSASSKGTWDCVRKARSAGLDVDVHEETQS